MTNTAGFLIYDGFDLQDIAIPYSMMAHAARPDQPDAPLFTLNTVARTKEIVTAHGGMQILPGHIYPDAEIYDVIIIPGGPGYQQALKVLRLMNWINTAARLAQIIAAVNTGVYLLAAARLLEGQTVAAVPGLPDAYPNLQTLESDAVVQSSKLLTIADNTHAQSLAHTIIKSFQDS